MEEKLDNSKMSKRNFTFIDWFVYYTATPAIIGVLLMVFMAVWVDYTPLMFKLLITLVLLSAFGLTWYRAVWTDYEYKGKGTQYHDDYSTLIEDEKSYAEIFSEWMPEDTELVSKAEIELAEDFCTYLDNMKNG